MSNPAWRAARNILCIRLDSMGDVLMTTPAFRAIRANAPDAAITLLTSPAGAAIAELIPEIGEVLTYNAPWMKADGSAAEDRAMIETLAQRRFEAAIIFTVFSQNPLPAALMCRLAGVPLVLAHSRERAYHLLSDEVPDPEPAGGIRHEVRRQLDLVAALGWRIEDERLSIALPMAARQVIDAAIAGRGLGGRPWAVLHPGASAPSRRYPHFAEVASLLMRDHGWQVVVTDGAPTKGIGGIDLSGQLDLPELAALIAAAPLLIANNSGPAHIAAAVGTPVVDLYALTNPQHIPWQVPAEILSHDVPCRWCYKSVCPEAHHACLDRVRPGDVVAAALSLVAA